ncbi:MAG: phage Gp37/Gp68 family protein [Pyrinomonadaceae bacterium]|nr:phage Gp37/Gp68 family protein [Pyrinomonadaceae bacterium]
MGFNSDIQWTDATWNIARGCTKVDEDCRFCYMYRDSFGGKRFNPLSVTKTKTVFDLPLRIKEPSKIFMSSLTDVYHTDCDSFRDEAFDIIRKCPQHTFQILTKRPERITEQTPKDILEMKNIWFGTSVGAEKGKHRIIDLLEVDCRTHFVSFEPLHGRVDMNLDLADLRRIDWAIIGGESGNETGLYRYRPCSFDWIRELVADLTPTTAIFIKQLGTHLAKEMKLKHRHGGDISEFPQDLQVREFPK